MATKPMTLERITRAAPYEGRPSWHAFFRMSPGAAWCAVVNDAGLPIIYASRQAAKEAARFTGACWRLAGPPRADV